MMGDGKDQQMFMVDPSLCRAVTAMRCSRERGDQCRYLPVVNQCVNGNPIIQYEK